MVQDLFDYLDFTVDSYGFTSNPLGWPNSPYSVQYNKGTGFVFSQILTPSQWTINLLRQSVSASTIVRTVIYLTSSDHNINGYFEVYDQTVCGGLVVNFPSGYIYDSELTGCAPVTVPFNQYFGIAWKYVGPSVSGALQLVITGIEFHYIDNSPLGYQPTVALSSPSTAQSSTNFATAINQALDPFIQAINQSTGGIISDSLSGVIGQISNLVTSLTGAINQQNTNNDAFLSSINNAIQTIAQGYTGAAQTINNATGGTLGDFVNTLLTSLAPDIAQPIEDAIGAIGSIGSGTTTAIQTLTGIIQDFIQTQQSNSVGNNVPSSTLYQGVFSNIIDPIQQWILNGLNILNSEYGVYINQILPILSNSINNVSGYFNNRGTQLNTILNNIATGQYQTFDQLWLAMSDKNTVGDFVQFIQNLIGMISLFNSVFQARVEPINKQISYLANTEFTPEILDINNTISLWLRGDISDTDRDDILHKHGFSDTVIQQLVYASQPKFSPDDARQLFWRGVITDLQQNGMLASLGYTPDNIQLIQTFNRTLLNPQDMIRLGDKHIYSADIPTIFGQYSEIDTGLVSALSQWGFSQEDIQKLWAAHWSLPSPEEIFRMLQRGIITSSDMNVYLQLTDFLPFFRDKLTQLSYNPIARVDVRRMYHDGTITADTLPSYYQKMGYSPDDSQLLAQWTVLHDNLSELPKQKKIRELSEGLIAKEYTYGLLDYQGAINALQNIGYTPNDATQIINLIGRENQVKGISTSRDKYGKRVGDSVLKGYTSRTLSQTETYNNLVLLGYTPQEAQLEMQYADYLHSDSINERIVLAVEKLYEHKQLSSIDLTNVLSSLGYVGSEIVQIQQDLDTFSSLRFKPITEAKLEKFAKDGIITQQDYVNEMQGLGYSDKYIAWYQLEIFGSVL